MSGNLTEYEGALKYAFVQVYGGAPGDWVAGKEAVDGQGHPVCDFENQSGIVLHVTDNGAADGFNKFSAKRTDAAGSEDMNMSMGPLWKNLKV